MRSSDRKDGASRCRPFDRKGASAPLYHVLAHAFGEQRHDALHIIANHLAGVAKARRRRQQPSEHDGLIDEITADGAPHYSLVERVAEAELAAAGSRSSRHMAEQMVGDPTRLLTADEQAQLRAMHTDFSANVDYATRQYAKERSAGLVTQITDTNRDVLRDIIGKGVASHWDIDTVADRLDDTGLFSDARAEMIARTEINAAHNSGILSAANAADRAGVGHYRKRWTLGDDPCPLCEANGDQDDIALEADFESGDDAPPLHPNCECELEIIEV